jgi:hypothetical protein
MWRTQDVHVPFVIQQTLYTDGLPISAANPLASHGQFEWTQLGAERA